MKTKILSTMLSLLIISVFVITGCSLKQEYPEGSTSVVIGFSASENDYNVAQGGAVFFARRHESLIDGESSPIDPKRGDHENYIDFLIEPNSDSVEVELNNGKWKFYIITWDDESDEGALTGVTRCAEVLQKLEGGEVSITFELGSLECSSTSFSGTGFSVDPEKGPMPLEVNNCQNLMEADSAASTDDAGCGSSTEEGDSTYIKVELVSQDENGNEISLGSECKSSMQDTGVRLPIGGMITNIKTRITGFDDSTCTNEIRKFEFDNGIANKSGYLGNKKYIASKKENDGETEESNVDYQFHTPKELNKYKLFLTDNKLGIGSPIFFNQAPRIDCAGESCFNKKSEELNNSKLSLFAMSMGLMLGTPDELDPFAHTEVIDNAYTSDTSDTSGTSDTSDTSDTTNVDFTFILNELKNLTNNGNNFCDFFNRSKDCIDASYSDKTTNNSIVDQNFYGHFRYSVTDKVYNKSLKGMGPIKIANGLFISGLTSLFSSPSSINTAAEEVSCFSIGSNGVEVAEGKITLGGKKYAVKAEISAGIKLLPAYLQTQNSNSITFEKMAVIDFTTDNLLITLEYNCSEELSKVGFISILNNLDSSRLEAYYDTTSEKTASVDLIASNRLPNISSASVNHFQKLGSELFEVKSSIVKYLDSDRLSEANASSIIAKGSRDLVKVSEVSNFRPGDINADIPSSGNFNGIILTAEKPGPSLNGLQVYINNLDPTTSNCDSSSGCVGVVDDIVDGETEQVVKSVQVVTDKQLQANDLLFLLHSANCDGSNCNEDMSLIIKTDSSFDETSSINEVYQTQNGSIFLTDEASITIKGGSDSRKILEEFKKERIQHLILNQNFMIRELVIGDIIFGQDSDNEGRQGVGRVVEINVETYRVTVLSLEELFEEGDLLHYGIPGNAIAYVKSIISSNTTIPLDIDSKEGEPYLKGSEILGEVTHVYKNSDDNQVANVWIYDDSEISSEVHTEKGCFSTSSVLPASGCNDLNNIADYEYRNVWGGCFENSANWITDHILFSDINQGFQIGLNDHCEEGNID